MHKFSRKSLSWQPKLAFCLLLSIALQFGHYANSQQSPFIVFLNSQESEQSTQIITAFKKRLSLTLPQAEYLSLIVDSASIINPSQLVSRKTKLPPTLIIALGTNATKIAQASFPETPLLSTMILQRNLVESHKNSAAILLQLPMEVQLTWLKKFLPNVRRVGILYDPSLSSNLVKEAENAARKNNIEIISYAVKSPKDLHAGLKEIYRKADALMAIPDQTVYSGITAKEVLLFSFRNRIPFIGLSSFWVKAGAFYALEVDYEDLGNQTAELAKKFIAGEPLGKGQAFYPEKTIYSVNIKTKDYLRLDISRDLIQGASITFE